MTLEQGISIAVLLAALGLFAWGKLRHDVVAVLALLAVTFTGLISPGDALAGFGHPAVITVASVLLISRALRNSGVVDLIGRLLDPMTATTTGHIASLSSVAALVSAFINNVGALAVLLPVALQGARRHGRPPALLLMPLAFASLLGGLMTLIGTPPNIIIASYRAETLGEPFHMFEFTPVGLPVAIAGILFMALAGWRLIPRQRRASKSPEEFFELAKYTIEVKLLPDSALIDLSLREANMRLDDAIIAGFVRGEGQLMPAAPWIRLREGDVLVLETDPATIQATLTKQGVELVTGREGALDRLRPASVDLVETVIQPRSILEGQFAHDLERQSGYSAHLLALARSGAPIRRRLASTRLQSGDVLLLQVEEGAGDVLGNLGLLPLARRDIGLRFKSRIMPALVIFGAAIAASATGMIPIEVAFLAATVVFVLIRLLPLRDLYQHIDWPVIVLLGAMIPVGRALEETGATDLIAAGFAELAGGAAPALILAGIMVITMLLSDVVNNAATALVMAPIGLALASGLQVSPDPFLMGIAIASSCAFLTPIGHQSNTLVMGPAGYHFADYWRMGLPLAVIVIAVALAAIVAVFPFHP